MASVTKIVIECDRCLAELDDHVEADASWIFRSENDRGKPVHYRLDLCSTHAEEFDTMTAGARIWVEPPVDRPPLSQRSPKRVPCVHCGEKYAAGTGMAQHVKHKHPEHYVPVSELKFEGAGEEDTLGPLFAEPITGSPDVEVSANGEKKKHRRRKKAHG